MFSRVRVIPPPPPMPNTDAELLFETHSKLELAVLLEEACGHLNESTMLLYEAALEIERLGGRWEPPEAS